MQSLYDRKAKSLNVRNLVNKTVVEYSGGNLHRKTPMGIFKMDPLVTIFEK
jgi:hypothetical protein